MKPATIPFTEEQIAAAKRYASAAPDDMSKLDPRVGALVEALIGRVADKWTLLIIEALISAGTLRFSRISEAVDGISQKMLTQTLRQMERDGLVDRKVYAVVPPKVEYTLTPLGTTLSAAFCGVWVWAHENLNKVEEARRNFDQGAISLADEDVRRTIIKAGVRQGK